MRTRPRGTRRSGTVTWNAALLAALLLADRHAGAFAATPDPPTAAVPAPETVDNIARAPELYDGRLLSVTGTISALGTIVDDWGHQYLMFRLVDGCRSITALVEDRQPISGPACGCMGRACSTARRSRKASLRFCRRSQSPARPKKSCRANEDGRVRRRPKITARWID
jgi:hypothetical protein